MFIKFDREDYTFPENIGTANVKLIRSGVTANSFTTTVTCGINLYVYLCDCIDTIIIIIVMII